MSGLRPYLSDIITESVAGGAGFEPTLAESESAVLPLDDPPSRDRADSTNLRDWVGTTALWLRPPNIGF